MKDKIKIFLIVLGLFFYQSETYAQIPNFTGTWVLNLEKSTLEHQPNGLTSSIFIIKQEGEKFKLTRYHIFGDNKKKISFKMVADGKRRRIKLLFNAKLEVKENSLLASLWRKNFSNVVKYSFGNNQNEFIADEVFKSNPKNHHNIWFFDREIPK
jgi:hypothetical protein